MAKRKPLSEIMSPATKFGRLTPLREAPDRVSCGANRRNIHRFVLCRCECGNEKEIGLKPLLRGMTISCGCARDDANARHAQAGGDAVRTHGMTKSPEFSSWRKMIDRCTNPRAHNWDAYGGRGIRICDRWLNSFEAFYADMGPRPTGTSIDRYPDNDGNYEPGNCRWATPKEQANNRRS